MIINMSGGGASEWDIEVEREIQGPASQLKTGTFTVMTQADLIAEKLLPENYQWTSNDSLDFYWQRLEISFYSLDVVYTSINLLVQNSVYKPDANRDNPTLIHGFPTSASLMIDGVIKSKSITVSLGTQLTISNPGSLTALFSTTSSGYVNHTSVGMVNTVTSAAAIMPGNYMLKIKVRGKTEKWEQATTFALPRDEEAAE